ncbi:Uncharacterised protein [Mobiluncus mulieris]|nr:Uncharacterised protein [Mobiluncus mulieris]
MNSTHKPPTAPERPSRPPTKTFKFTQTMRTLWGIFTCAKKLSFLSDLPMEKIVARRAHKISNNHARPWRAEK